MTGSVVYWPAVFIPRTHYPSRRTWANIVVGLVMGLKYKDGHKTHYASG